MKVIKKISEIIDIIVDKIGYVCAYAVIPLMLLIVFEVVMRRFLSRPTLWSYEIILMIYGFYCMMISAYGLQKGVLVCVDLFSNHLNMRNKHILLLITYIIFFLPFITLAIPFIIKYVLNSWAIKETSWSTWAPYIYPIKTVMPIGFILLWLQGIAEILKSIIFLVEDGKR